MPLATLLFLLPPALLVAAALAGWALRPLAPGAGRAAAAGASWLGIAVLAVAWFAGARAAQDLTAPFAVAGVTLTVRLDDLTVFLWLTVLTPVALLLTFQRRASDEAALAALAAAAALGTLAAGSVGVTALGLATTAGLALLVQRRDDPRPAWSYWAALTGAWLLLTWTAVLLQVTSGTSAYGAVPVTALHVPLLALLAAAGLLCSGLLPWRTWVSDAWTRPRLESWTLAVALLVPAGFSPLVRAYGLGAGQLPSQQLNVALTAIGAATALGAAIRAQAASSRRGFLGEAVPLAGGMALLGLGLGTPLGLVACLACLAGLGVAAGLAPLAADRTGGLPAAAAAVLVGVPPALGFGGWLLAIQGALEAGPAGGFLALLAAAAWVVALGAAARSARLPLAPPDAELTASRRGVLAGLAIALAGGVALTALLALLAIPAAAQVMPPTGRLARPVVLPADILGPGSLMVSTATGGWAAALLGGPVVVIGLAAAAAVRLLRRGAAGAGAEVAEPPLPVPEPLFPPPLDGVPERAIAWLGSLRLPEDYQSLFRPGMLERAASGPPWFWVVSAAVLAFLVTR